MLRWLPIWLINGLTVPLGTVFELVLPEGTQEVKIVEGDDCSRPRTAKLSSMACWGGSCQPSPIDDPPQITAEGAVWYPMQISRRGAYSACVGGQIALHIYIIAIDLLRDTLYCQVGEQCYVSAVSGRGGLDSLDSLLVVEEGQMCGSVDVPTWEETLNTGQKATYRSTTTLRFGTYEICYCEAKAFQPVIDCSLISNHFQRIGQLIVVGIDHLEKVCFRHEEDCELRIRGNAIDENDRIVVSSGCPPFDYPIKPIGPTAEMRNLDDTWLLYRFPIHIFPAKFCYCSSAAHNCDMPSHFSELAATVELSGWADPPEAKCQADHNCTIVLPDALHEARISKDVCPPINPHPATQTGATIVVSPLQAAFEYKICIRGLDHQTWGFGGDITVWSNIRDLNVRYQQDAAGILASVSMNLVSSATVRCGIAYDNVPESDDCGKCVSTNMGSGYNVVGLPVKAGFVYCTQTSDNCTVEACTIRGPTLPLDGSVLDDILDASTPLIRMVGQNLGLQLNSLVRLMDWYCMETECAQPGASCIMREPQVLSLCMCPTFSQCVKLRDVEYQGPRPVDLKEKPGDVQVYIEGKSLQGNDELSFAPVNYGCVNWIKSDNYTSEDAAFLLPRVDVGEYTICWRRSPHPYVEIGRMSVQVSRDCVVSQWTLLACSVPCGNGTFTRKREVLQPMRGFGKECPSVIEEHNCTMPACPKWKSVIVEPAKPTPTQTFTLTVPEDTSLLVFFVLAGQPCETFLASDAFVGRSPCGPFSPRRAGVYRLCFCTEACVTAFSATPPLFVEIVDAEEEVVEETDDGQWLPLFIAVGVVGSVVTAVGAFVWRKSKVRAKSKIDPYEAGEAAVLDIKSPSGSAGLHLPRPDVPEPDPEADISVGKEPKYSVNIEPLDSLDSPTSTPSYDFLGGATPEVSSADPSPKGPGVRGGPVPFFRFQDSNDSLGGAAAAKSDGKSIHTVEVESEDEIVSVPDQEEIIAVPKELPVSRNEIVNVPKKEILEVPEEEIIAVPNEDIIAVPKEEPVAAPLEDEIVAVPNEDIVAVPREEPIAAPHEDEIVAVPNEEEFIAVPREEPIAAAHEEEIVAVPNEEEIVAVTDDDEEIIMVPSGDKAELSPIDSKEVAANPHEDDEVGCVADAAEAEPVCADEEEVIAVPLAETATDEASTVPNDEAEILPGDEGRTMVSVETNDEASVPPLTALVENGPVNDAPSRPNVLPAMEHPESCLADAATSSYPDRGAETEARDLEKSGSWDDDSGSEESVVSAIACYQTKSVVQADNLGKDFGFGTSAKAKNAFDDSGSEESVVSAIECHMTKSALHGRDDKGGRDANDAKAKNAFDDSGSEESVVSAIECHRTKSAPPGRDDKGGRDANDAKAKKPVFEDSGSGESVVSAIECHRTKFAPHSSKDGGSRNANDAKAKKPAFDDSGSEVSVVSVIACHRTKSTAHGSKDRGSRNAYNTKAKKPANDDSGSEESVVSAIECHMTKSALQGRDDKGGRSANDTNARKPADDDSGSEKSVVSVIECHRTRSTAHGSKGKGVANVDDAKSEKSAQSRRLQRDDDSGSEKSVVSVYTNHRIKPALHTGSPERGVCGSDDAKTDKPETDVMTRMLAGGKETKPGKPPSGMGAPGASAAPSQRPRLSLQMRVPEKSADVKSEKSPSNTMTCHRARSSIHAAGLMITRQQAQQSLSPSQHSERPPSDDNDAKSEKSVISVITCHRKKSSTRVAPVDKDEAQEAFRQVKTCDNGTDEYMPAKRKSTASVRGRGDNMAKNAAARVLNDGSSDEEETMEGRIARLRREREAGREVKYEVDETVPGDSGIDVPAATGSVFEDGSTLMLHLRRKSQQYNPK